MYKILLLIVLFATTSCDYFVRNSDEVQALHKRTITYDDFRIETDNLGNSVYLDTLDQRLTGHYTVTYQNSITEEIQLKNGLIDGFHKNFTNGIDVSSEINYEEGAKHGSSLRYYPDGTLLMEGMYKHGVLQGDEVSYDENGDIAAKRTFADNIQYQHYYQNNKIAGSEFKKNIRGTVYDLIVTYDNFENMQMVLGRIGDTEDPVFYVFDTNFNLIEAVNVEQDPVKATQYLQALGGIQ